MYCICIIYALGNPFHPWPYRPISPIAATRQPPAKLQGPKLENWTTTQKKGREPSIQTAQTNRSTIRSLSQLLKHGTLERKYNSTRPKRETKPGEEEEED
ncbi:uncharacterized protein MCYG_04261 [Microsporum canis CBS 113480]|uniref:Uncharacterized protein n=1 Tax=Arthroderma otae (strain ATCC MYA-4605 / CBS 113480) TaxID=554155 RepID=C5FPC6_ARTOC|nr:uncharacterized protein MCYG_04261 [Microsporum canis CBS 113480]EEQ31442.1 predicted protein [Microsporum canis CBS 113480]